jgi:hypothetical protein
MTSNVDQPGDFREVAVIGLGLMGWRITARLRLPSRAGPFPAGAGG